MNLKRFQEDLRNASALYESESRAIISPDTGTGTSCSEGLRQHTPWACLACLVSTLRFLLREDEERSRREGEKIFYCESIVFYKNIRTWAIWNPPRSLPRRTAKPYLVELFDALLILGLVFFFFFYYYLDLKFYKLKWNEIKYLCCCVKDMLALTPSSPPSMAFTAALLHALGAKSSRNHRNTIRYLT